MKSTSHQLCSKEATRIAAGLCKCGKPGEVTVNYAMQEECSCERCDEIAYDRSQRGES